MADPTFRVMLRMQIITGKEEEFEKTWYGIGSVITDEPANGGQWLLKSNDEPSVYYIMSDWVNEPLFRTFEHSATHLEHRTKLHPFRNGGSMATMSVVFHLPKEQLPAGKVGAEQAGIS
jgi:heme-degrading monooxygenase HmoA